MMLLQEDWIGVLKGPQLFVQPSQRNQNTV
jgi:hypothetical protein